MINFTEEIDADIAIINNSKSERLTEINESYNNNVAGLKATHGITIVKSNANDKFVLKDGLIPLKETKDLAIKLCNETFLRDITNRNERYKSDCKVAISSRNEFMRLLCLINIWIILSKYG